ncbi:MAG: tRNA (adenosine(37)-N6)-threonylcarbamoyltransferase complex dimerization subunit type 1 TsaB [Desulfobulbaceae bacterium]|nr:tRNA (adenosine(37)-N6)-threonylcarbamoyltransferase complex dimerization subunit type 1 TsaB [Desulfobulbaceae bacterium]
MAQHGTGTTHTSGPIILAIENSGMCGSVALVTPGLCLAEYSLTSTATHSRRLLPSIQQILTETGVTWEGISAIAISAGPGSFTGLRIGLTTAKGLAMASGKPLIAVNSLDNLAAQMPWTDKLICPVLDARKQEVYTACYRCDIDGVPRRVSEIVAITPGNLAQTINEDVIFLGDGAEIYQGILQEGVTGRASFAKPEIFFLRAAALGGAALTKFHRQDFLDTANATPDYIRPSEAELSLKPPKSGTSCQ